MEKTISDFIKANRIASISCIDEENKPYCFHCFYAFDEKNHLLFFKSSISSLHSKLLTENSNIAGSILPEKHDFLALKGIQLTGRVLNEPDLMQINPEIFYHKVFPLAFAKPGKVWCIDLLKIKMSDNTNIFGKKLFWEKELIKQKP